MYFARLALSGEERNKKKKEGKKSTRNSGDIVNRAKRQNCLSDDMPS